VPLQRRDELYVGWVAVCHYCGHEVGRANGRAFGRDVPAEPGARGGRLLPLLDQGEPPARDRSTHD